MKVRTIIVERDPWWALPLVRLGWRKSNLQKALERVPNLVSTPVRVVLL